MEQVFLKKLGNNGELWVDSNSTTGKSMETIQNFDSNATTYTNGYRTYWNRSSGETWTDRTNGFAKTSRPTNTSVLYCIKY